MNKLGKKNRLVSNIKGPLHFKHKICICKLISMILKFGITLTILHDLNMTVSVNTCGDNICSCQKENERERGGG